MQFLYAFTVTPLKSMDLKELTQQPAAITDCPYRDMRTQVHRHGIPMYLYIHTSTYMLCESATFLFIQPSGAQDDIAEQNFFFDAKSLAAGKKRKHGQDQRHQQRRGHDRQGGEEGDGAGLLPNPKRQARDGGKQRAPPAPRGPCWFCLGGAEVEKHLVVSIGEHVSP